MKQTEVVQRLYESEPDSQQAADLMRDLLDAARYPGRLAVKTYLSASDSIEKGMAILADLQEFALVPLTESSGMPNASTEVWVLRTLSEEMVEFRRQSAAVLSRLLENRSTVPGSTAGADPELPEDTRVCDVAYLLLHRILHLGTTATQFLGESVEQRNARIQDLQNSDTFQSFFESQP